MKTLPASESAAPRGIERRAHPRVALHVGHGDDTPTVSLEGPTAVFEPRRLDDTPTVSLDGPTSVFVRSITKVNGSVVALAPRVASPPAREPHQQVPRPMPEDPLGMPPPLKRAQFAKPSPDSFEARSQRAAAFKLRQPRVEPPRSAGDRLSSQGSRPSGASLAAPPRSAGDRLSSQGSRPSGASLPLLRRAAAELPRWLRDPQSRADYPELLRELSLEPNDLRRNQVPYVETTRAADLVDVATGNVVLCCRDFALGGACPVVMERVWLSCSRYRGPLGIGWHHAFDLALVRGSDCVAVRLADGRVVWFPEPSRNQACHDSVERLTLSQDAYGYVLRAADGCRRRFVAHRAQAACVLSSASTRDGQELRFGYDHRARLARITASAECSLELEYDTHDRLLRIDAPDVLHANKRLVVVAYAYDEDGHLRKAANALGQPQRYIHERGSLIARVNRNGGSTHFNWDARERCVHCWIDGGVRDRKLTYLDGSTLVVDSLGYETAYHHDGALVRRIVDPTGHTREFMRGTGRRVECEQDELGRCQHRSYDARGNLSQLCMPDGAIWRFEYDRRDRLLRAVDALSGVWQFEYCDSTGRLVSHVDPLGRSFRYAYRGRWLVAVYEPDGRQTRLAYDAAGNLATCIGPTGCATRYVHDAWGQLVAIIDEEGQRHERHYDPLGRLIRMRGPDGTRCELAYDAEGNLTSWRDGERTLRFTYQGSGRISSRQDDGATLCLEYDSEEQLVAIVNEHGRVYRIARSCSGAVREICGLDGCVRSYTRDAAGRVTRRECGGEYSEYEYDSADRLIEVLHSDGGFEGYRYRADGALESAWNQHIALELERDALGRVIVERQGQHAIESQYDAASRRTGVQSSLGMRQLLEYSGLGALRRISERSSGFELGFERDALGLELERLLPGGLRSVWARDAFGQPSSQRLEAADGELRSLVEYAWHPGGRLSRVIDSQRGATDFHYDGFVNLAWSQSDDGSYRLRMPDAVGNLFSRDDRRDREYGAGGQILTRSGPEGEATWSYDARGNTCERRDAAGRSFRYAWNVSGTLRSVICPDGNEVSFAYDPLGRRIWKKFGGRTTRWLWDGPAPLHEWIEPDTGRPEPLTWLRDPASGHLLAQLTAAGARAILGDHAGTPLQLLHASGMPLWAAGVDIYGAPSLQLGERQACPLRAWGMYEDAETGLFFDASCARYYDPVTGTYLSPAQGLDAPGLRAYALERPTFVVTPEALQGRAAAAPVRWTQPVTCGVVCDAWTLLRDRLPAVYHQPPSAAGGGHEPYDAQAAYAAAHGIPLIRPPKLVLLATPARSLAP